jgi:Activator of Hsp90 ATPase homolog 1-like protein
MTTADHVRVTTVVPVDPAAAFEVFTGQVDAWWKRGPRYRPGRLRLGIMRFDPPGVGGRLLEVYDEASGDAFEVGRVRVWKPAEKLVFEFRARNFEPDQSTEVEVRFEAVAGGTRVTLEHRGWDSIPLDHPARHGWGASGAFTSMMGLFWADLATSLRDHVEAARA